MRSQVVNGYNFVLLTKAPCPAPGPFSPLLTSPVGNNRLLIFQRGIQLIGCCEKSLLTVQTQCLFPFLKPQLSVHIGHFLSGNKSAYFTKVFLPWIHFRYAGDYICGYDSTKGNEKVQGGKVITSFNLFNKYVCCISIMSHTLCWMQGHHGKQTESLLSLGSSILFRYSFK